jgi:hypothetical protein
MPNEYSKLVKCQVGRHIAEVAKNVTKILHMLNFTSSTIAEGNSFSIHLHFIILQSYKKIMSKRKYNVHCINH